MPRAPSKRRSAGSRARKPRRSAAKKTAPRKRRAASALAGSRALPRRTEHTEAGRMILAALFVIAGCAWMIRALAADQSSREAAAVLSRNLSFAAAHSGVIAERMTLGGREVLRSLAADIRGAAAERLRAGPNSGIIIRPWLARTLSTDQESGFTASPLRPVIRMVNGPSPWVRSVERGVIAGEPPGAETEKQ